MDKKEISYTAAIKEIETILGKIENQELDVDELAGKLRRVTELIKTCKSKLHSAESEVDKILKEIGD
ncbi:MAG: exodeoxyribonuclease VII small subunit [Bacteroidetes bacterium]|jgi:exodeoxyribonuclease VII small subunit|nr:exodeoxyribonuclease VII small subunit [Bacteroidota bacterium]MBT3748919.1 exodeoxyribonuclease VII small subunit [Bacteroidota bacterium]MBT4401425.1 exodeoxyribonuclease VII small subunit [Bacteroidota bacterium]MBT4410689.1 exodeoxyribonuclease VII small subunit [Bacteroidota bacterium]MBT5426363.1 exodeoxyribonuclease VII small subunit [Bacteroidota bacterium]